MLALLESMFYSSIMVFGVVALLLPLLGMAAVTVIYILCDLFTQFRTWAMPDQAACRKDERNVQG